MNKIHAIAFSIINMLMKGDYKSIRINDCSAHINFMSKISKIILKVVYVYHHYCQFRHSLGKIPNPHLVSDISYVI